MLDLTSISRTNFEDQALSNFKFQFENNAIYQEYCRSLNKIKPHSISEFPFLPIQFFKTHQVTCYSEENLSYFESSGTSGHQNSKHFYKDLSIYNQSIDLGFQHFFGQMKHVFIGLLPHYLERENSSLVSMVKHWMQSNEQDDYFFLNNFEDLNQCILNQISQNKPIILIGLNSALYDFSLLFKNSYPNLNIIETGGNKGSGQELSKQDFANQIKTSFPNSRLISEYGMCELFSQAYSDEDFWFSCPHWMRVYVSDLNDPLEIKTEGRGLAKMIDLANVYSCSFIETQDMIELRSDGKFQILGRAEASDLRGCNLMYN